MIERQQRDLQNIARAVGTASIARDYERMRRIRDARSVAKGLQHAIGVSPIVRDIERMQRVIGASSILRDMERMQRTLAANSVIRDIGRIALTISRSNVAQDYRGITRAIQAQQERALRAQRVLSRSPVFQVLDRIKRVTEIQQRQLTSIAQAASGSSFAHAISRVNRGLVSSAIAKDIQGIARAARRALGVSLDFRPLERIGASLLEGLRRPGVATAGAAPDQRPGVQRKSPLASRDDAEATADTPYVVDPVAKEMHMECRIMVFLAKLPTYIALLEDPPPKHRMH